MTSEVISKTYKSVEEEVEALEIPLKEKLLAVFLALLTSLLIAIGPIAVCINCLIFNNYMRVFAFGITLCVIFIGIFTDILYLHTICKKRVQGLYHIWAIDALYIIIVCLIIFYAIILMGVL